MHALIVGSAPARDENGHYAKLLADSPFVVGADGGAVFSMEMGRVPDVAVGDFDSSSAEALRTLRQAGVRIITHPAAKDDTDLDIALRFAREDGATRVSLTAAFSDRLDHTLAAFGTLMRAVDLHGEVLEPTFSAWVVGGDHPSIRLSGKPGTTLSLIAPAGASGVTLDGMRYPLHAASLEPMSSLGVSNVLAADEAEVVVEHGLAIVIAEGERRPPKVWRIE